MQVAAGLLLAWPIACDSRLVTKVQLDEIIDLLAQLGWGPDRARRYLGFSVFNNPQDTSPVLARASIIKLRRAVPASAQRVPASRAVESQRGSSTTPAAGSSVRVSSAKQRSYIRSLLKRAVMSEEQGARLVGSACIDELDVRQASDLIERLLKERGLHDSVGKGPLRGPTAD